MVSGKTGPQQQVAFVLTADEVRASPIHEETEVDFGDSPSDYVDQFERGMLGGGFVWPYTDV